jgi:hypothetical protein
MISGKVHFGWARVTVTTSGKTFTATRTGYAYETIPNKSIIAGKTKGPNDAGAKPVGQGSAPTPQAPTLVTNVATHKQPGDYTNF